MEVYALYRHRDLCVNACRATRAVSVKRCRRRAAKRDRVPTIRARMVALAPTWAPIAIRVNARQVSPALIVKPVC